MSDPLSLLREHIINKKPVSHDDTHIITGDLKFPRSVLTAYKQDRGRGDPYPLEAIYYLLQKPHLAGAAKTRLYAEECKVHNFQRVLLADQKDVLAYMTGKQDTSQYLVSVEELTALAVPQSQEVPAAAKVPERPEKRKREEVTLDMTDEKTIASKKALGERIATLAIKPIEGPEEKKKARLPVMLGDKSDEIKRTDSQYILADKDITLSIMERERTHLSRTTCLHTSNGKDFRNLHEIVRGAIASRKSGTAKGKISTASASNRPDNATQPAAGRRDRYNVSGVEAFKAAGMDADLLRAEQQGSSLLSSSVPNQQSSSNKPSSDAKVPSKRAPQGEPIIIVPQAASAVVTKWNVKLLLEKGEYRTREEQKASGYKPEERVSVIHQEDGHSYHYKVVDSADSMKKEDWQRVVAVFVQGPDWQFKQWDLSTFGGKMVNMFQRVCGFHVVFDKDQPHENVKKFSVKLLSLSRNNRHLDNQVKVAFWDALKAQRRLSSQIREKARMAGTLRA